MPYVYFNRYSYIIKAVSYQNAHQTAQVTLWHGSTKKANLNFYDSTAAANRPANVTSSVITVRFHTSRFADVVDLLRNEKPVRLAHASAGREVQLESYIEPVGEEET